MSIFKIEIENKIHVIKELPSIHLIREMNF